MSNLLKQISAILLTSVFLLACENPDSTSQEAFIKNLDAEQFRELVEAGEGITLDVRTPEEVAEGYIPTATDINLHDADFEERINLLPKDKDIYVYCKVGGRSSKAAEILQKNGFTKIYHLENGIAEWKEKGFPLSKPE